MSRCLQCGKCCELIWLSASMDGIRNFSKQTEDQRFVLKHWKQVSYEKALRINKEYVTRIQDRGETKLNFFVCSCYDKLNKKCTVNGSKPPICKDYPFYGKIHNPANTELFADCGYWLDKMRWRVIARLGWVCEKRTRKGDDQCLKIREPVS